MFTFLCQSNRLSGAFDGTGDSSKSIAYQSPVFEITNPRNHTWDDDEGLLNFGADSSDADFWRIRDACEGVLILGAVGSGKTSGSGSAIAKAFLTAGFGGLVLTAKPDEARRWLRLCEQTGRMGDCVHVKPGSGHGLNILQYEAERPGDRVSITDDLIGLLGCIIGVMSRSKQKSERDDFWSNAKRGLLKNLLEVFLLAGEPITIHGLVRFVNSAPTSPDCPWRTIPLFGGMMARAEKKSRDGSRGDKDDYADALEYWTKSFPREPDVTRGGYVAAFTAMANYLTGRGVGEILCGETNLTPEAILSGKIVILDFPIKESQEEGNMVQATWKLLFQQAVERRADKGLNSARPAFLWEDEGHEFFSQQDVRFQPTARDCRIPHVIISQNIQNFLHLGHSEHAVEAVFSAMNTYIFHTNADLYTNRWASEHIGEEKRLTLTTDGLIRPRRSKDFSFSSRRPEEVENVGGMQIFEEKKQSVRPEDFSKLKRGGDGTCEAVILWLSHRFAINQNRNFSRRIFEQEKRTT
jgi:hypothetical protein